MFARDLVDLRVWNNVKTQCRHRRIVAQFASRAVAFRTRMIAALLLDKHPNVPTNRMHETSASLRGVLSARARSALFAIHSLDHRASRVEHLDVHARSFCQSHRRFLRFGRDRLGNRAAFVHSD